MCVCLRMHMCVIARREMCVCVYVRVRHSTQGDLRTTCLSHPLPLPHACQASNSAQQGWQQVPFPAELTNKSNLLTFNN